jgi:hypothetical protein
VTGSSRTPDNDGRWIIASENQYCWDWRVDAISGDPPVLSACMDDGLTELLEVTPKLSEFIQGFLLREALFGSRYKAALDSFDDVSRLEPLKLSCQVVSVPSNLYFSQEGQILVYEEVGTWWFGSNSVDPRFVLGLSLDSQI